MEAVPDARTRKPRELNNKAEQTPGGTEEFPQERAKETISSPSDKKDISMKAPAAVKVKVPNAKNATLRAARAQKAQLKVAPTFGISPLKLFPVMTGCIILCAFDAMPFGISELWLIPLLALFFGYYETNKRRQDHKAAIGIVSDKEVLAMVMKEMPAWYSFKDVETVNWLNDVLKSVWPYVDAGVSDQLTDEIVPPLLEGLVPGVRLELTKMTLGSVAPVVTGIRASHVSKSEVLLDLELKWSSDIYALLEVGFKLAPFPMELLDVQFSGKLRVKLSPLIPYQPFVGAVQVSYCVECFTNP